MWTRIEIISEDNKIIYLPSSLAETCGESVTISFGKKSVSTYIQYTDEVSLGEDSSFERPGTIRISSRLKEELLIQETLVYRIKITCSSISIGPVIGLLLGAQTHRYNPRHMMKYSDRLGIYNEVGGLIYAFSPKSINWKKGIVYGLYYNTGTDAWEYGRFPIPEVIYRRNFHTDPKLIKRLIEFTGGRLFNSYRFSKYELYNYINSNTELSRYLPTTALLDSFDQVKSFVDCHLQVILKPIDLSRGRGICILEKTGTAYKITDYRYRSPYVTVLEDTESLESFFIMNKNSFNRYIIQKYLSLARIEGGLFDVRVVMQKTRDKLWGCTGIECRVSSRDSHITNISRGGYALPLEKALSQAFGYGYEFIPQKLSEFCQKFCTYMDEMGEHFSEFGMDIAVDTNKDIWLIEANVFPSFKGFKEMDKDIYLSIRYAPLRYAVALTDFCD